MVKRYSNAQLENNPCVPRFSYRIGEFTLFCSFHMAANKAPSLRQITCDELFVRKQFLSDSLAGQLVPKKTRKRLMKQKVLQSRDMAARSTLA